MTPHTVLVYMIAVGAWKPQYGSILHTILKKCLNRRRTNSGTMLQAEEDFAAGGKIVNHNQEPKHHWSRNPHQEPKH